MSFESIDIKNVKKVIVDPYCLNNKPGYHTITIYYINNTSQFFILQDKFIFDNLYEFMEENCKRHFYYLIA